MKMPQKNKSRNLIFLISLVSVSILSTILFPIGIAAAEEQISLQAAIETGWGNNRQLVSLKGNISKLEGELARIKAEQDWQVSLGTDISYTIIEGERISPPGQDNSLSLETSKVLPSGLVLSPEMQITEWGLNPDITIRFSKPILPAIPSSLEQRLIRNQKSLLKAQAELEQEKATKVISWLESYFNIIRMMEKQVVKQERVLEASNKLREAQALQKLNEIGKSDVINADINLETAKYQLEKLKRDIETAGISFCQELGLPDGQEIYFTAEDELIREMTNKAEQLTGKHLDLAELMIRLGKVNYQLQVNKIDLVILEEELDWLERGGKSSLGLTGSYDLSDEELTLGMSFSYHLYDGGQHQLDIAAKRTEIDDKKAVYNQLYDNLQEELRQAINTIELTELQLKQEELRLENSKYQELIIKQQLELGIVQAADYNASVLQRREAEINLKGLKDQVILDKLELLSIINTDQLLGGM